MATGLLHKRGSLGQIFKLARVRVLRVFVYFRLILTSSGPALRLLRLVVTSVLVFVLIGFPLIGLVEVLDFPPHKLEDFVL